jgi:hypothetical protein
MAGFETTNTTTMNTNDRFDRLQWLRESCTEEFVNTTIVDEMVNWTISQQLTLSKMPLRMGEDDFNDFYDHLCSNWNLAKDFKTLLEYNGEQ